MIEVAGFASRVPGAQNKQEFWKLLKNGQCSVTEIPDDRWSKFHYWHPRQREPGKTYTFSAGVLDDILAFDPSVFGISPREAEQMDPQQRIILEATWEAIEDAGIAPSELAGKNIGVFVGSSALDSANMNSFDPSSGTGHFMTGNTLSIIANRISYVFDLKGPSYTVDTACSSSLVALHEAYEALDSGRIDTAIVAGVNILGSLFPFIGFAQATMLSPEGLCRAFDERAYGYVRSEGCLVFILRRGDAPRWPGQRAHANIVGVDINSDGRTIGMSLPSGLGQAALLERIYDKYAIDANSLAFIEAHGTGTRVGDPAEAEAIGEILGRKRKAPLPIGSVKTNIGHLEPASGLAGLAKAILALQNNYLPASLHCDNPNPDIDFDGLNIEVASKGRKLPRTRKIRYAGVNSFGFGGTNAHVIISDPLNAPEPCEKTDSSEGIGLLMLSAETEAALRETAQSYAARINYGEDDLNDLQSAAYHRRAMFRERLVVHGKEKADISSALLDFSNSQPNNTYIHAARNKTAGKCAFVFSGNGAQWPGMGQQAYRESAVFKASFDEVSSLFSSYTDFSIRELLFADDLEERLELTSIAQPLIFAIQVALADTLAAFGLKPDITFGHSIGEAAASVTAGKISKADAVRLVYHRSTNQEVAAGLGSMAALVLSEEEARKAIIDSGFHDLEIAAVNSFKSVTLSGPNEEIQGFAHYAKQNRLVFRPMVLNYPFHSALIESLEAPFRRDIQTIEDTPSDLLMISTVTGEAVRDGQLNADYWWDNLRQPVNFAESVSSALEAGATSFIEIGPKPVLSSYLKQNIGLKEVHATVLPSLNIHDGKGNPVIPILAAAVAEGITVDEAIVFADNPDIPLSLPGYPWQHVRYASAETPESNLGLTNRVANPLIGWRLNDQSNIWCTHLDALVLPFLADHVVDDQAIFPGAGYIEMMLAVAHATFGDEVPVEIHTLDIISAMRLSEQYLLEVQTALNVETGTVKISSRRRGSTDEWQFNAQGRIFKAIEPDEMSKPSHTGPSDVTASGQQFYDRASKFGLTYGPNFKRAKLITKFSNSSYCVQLAKREEKTAFTIHPADLDCCFHGLISLFDEVEEANIRAFVPIYFDRIQQFASGKAPAFAEINISKISEQSILADFLIFDDDDALLIKMTGARFRATDFNLKLSADNLTYRVESRLMSPLMEVGQAYLRDLPSGDELFDRLQEAGLDIDGEEQESHLLLDVAAQKFAIEIGHQLSDKQGFIDVQKIPETDSAYFFNALNKLEEFDDLENVGDGLYRLTDKNELPDFDLFIRSIVDESPEEAANATLLSLSRRHALQVLSDQSTQFKPSGALLDHVRFAVPEAFVRQSVIQHWLDLFLKKWPEERPLSILDLAGSALANAGYIERQYPSLCVKVCIADADNKSAARLSSNLDSSSHLEVVDISKGLKEALDGHRFDLILSSGRLHALTRVADLGELTEFVDEEVAFIAVEPVVDTLQDLSFGFCENWFDTNSLDNFPISGLRSSHEWQRILEQSGFQGTESIERVIDGVSLNIVSGRLIRKINGISSSSFEDSNTHYVLLISNVEVEKACADRIAEKLSASGVSASKFTLPDDFDEEGDKTFQIIVQDEAFQNASERIIVHMASIMSQEQEPLDIIMERCLPTIHLMQALEGLSASLTFVIPSGSGLGDGDHPHAAAQSGLWSFARVVANEAQNVTVRSIDIAIDNDHEIISDKITAALLSDEASEEIIINATSTKRPHVVRGLSRAKYSPAEAVTLGFDRPGVLDSLKWTERKRPTLGPDEVEIQVVATGLNFRDVMWALGMLPEEALEDGYGGAAMGLECSGRVVRVGKNVVDLTPGDAVVAFTSSGFGNFVTVPAFAVARVPETEDLTAAATIPIAFLTAYYSLIHLGALSKGQWLLLHGAAGGVGLAALQIAKWVGAKVIATAGSDEKRELLSMLGADHVLNSRSLNFADEVKQITGQGVHAVLNSLAGEAMERGINTLRPFGRFLELGKRDYYSNTKIGLRPFRRNISYFGIDLDQLLLHDQALTQKLIKQIFNLVQERTFVPLPYRVFDGTNVQEAFRLMQRSGHIGKILVTPPEPQSVLVPPKLEALRFADHGAHIVIGGLGGFGGEIARWLADHGAKTIILASRSGKVSQDHLDLIDRLAERDVEILPVACDVTDHKDLERMFVEFRSQMPIKGIIHAAMVLDDGMLTSLTRERFEKVLAPKVRGAKYLDQLTWQDNLDYFILFSSATTLIGNPGQSHYVAANGYLEGLARERRRLGRPALAVGWGAIGDVGFLARNQEVSEKLSRHLGEAMIKARKGLDVLSKAMVLDDGSIENAVLHIGRFNWSSAHQTLPLLKSAMFADVVSGRDSRSDTTDQIDLHALVVDKQEAEARQIVAKLLATEIAAILRMSTDEISLKRPLTELGMDSLMGLELRMSVQNRFGLDMPLVALSGTTCLDDVSNQVLKMVLQTEAGAALDTNSDNIALARQHLSDEIQPDNLVAVENMILKKQNAMTKPTQQKAHNE